jgi:hypothetical protein
VIIAETRGSEVVAKFAAAFGCAFDFEIDTCSPSEHMSGGVEATPLNSARRA